MNANGHFDEEDLALYAMHSLTEEESASVRAHLQQCEACSRELAALRADLALYAQTLELQEVPAGSRDRFLGSVALEPRAQSQVPSVIAQRHAADFATEQPVEAPRSPATPNEGRPELVAPLAPRRGVVRTIAPWIGWALAASVTVIATNLARERDALKAGFSSQTAQMAQLSAQNDAARQVLDTLTDKSAMRVSMSKSATPKVPSGRATYVASKGSLLFLASNMAPLQPSKVYELWLLPADGSKPVPAGTFEPDARGNGSVILPQLTPGVQAKAFAVTIENQGGALTPTAPILMVGA